MTPFSYNQPLFADLNLPHHRVFCPHNDPCLEPLAEGKKKAVRCLIDRANKILYEVTCSDLYLQNRYVKILARRAVANVERGLSILSTNPEDIVNRAKLNPDLTRVQLTQTRQQMNIAECLLGDAKRQSCKVRRAILAAQNSEN